MNQMWCNKLICYALCYYYTTLPSNILVQINNNNNLNSGVITTKALCIFFVTPLFINENSACHFEGEG